MFGKKYKDSPGSFGAWWLFIHFATKKEKKNEKKKLLEARLN